MSTSQNQTASGRPLRVSPAWVGGARPAAGSVNPDHLLPVREAVWIWSVRRYARLALWALPAAALLDGWVALGIDTPPGPLAVELAADWLTTIAMIALAALLAGSRTRRPALIGLLIGLAGVMLTLPLAALPHGTLADGVPLTVSQLGLATTIATATTGTAWLLLGWAVFRSRLVNPADGILLMLAAAALSAGTYTHQQPLPTVGALLLLAAGTGLAWTGGRLIPHA
jgi:Amt family ammonium transporter